MKHLFFLLAPVLALLLPGCQAATAPTGGPGFDQFNMPGSRMGMQNVDLDD